MTIKEKIELLQKPVWTYKDIMCFFGRFGKTKANDIKNKVIENGGGIKYSTKYVKTESVLNYFGTTREEEIKVLKETEESEVLDERTNYSITN